MDEIVDAGQEPLTAIGEIARNLLHPLPIGLLNDSSDFDSTSLKIDDEEHEVSDQAESSEHFDAKEIGCGDDAPMSLEERLPRHPFTAERRRVDTVFNEDSLDGVSANLVPQVVECSSNSSVSPGRIFAGHPQDQLPDWGSSLGTTDTAALAAIILLRDKPPVPSKQGVWRHQGADLEEPISADYFGLRGETAALAICEKQALPTQLLAEHPILLLQILDDALLTAIHPPGEDHQQEMKLKTAHQIQHTSVLVKEVG